MNKGRRIAGFALLTGVAIGLTFYVTRPREPVYQGRALSEWLAELNEFDPRHQEAHARASEAVRQIGTNAIPHLRKMLRFENSPSKERINLLLDKQSVFEFRFKCLDSNAAMLAHSGCVALGPGAKDLLPELRHYIFDIGYSDYDGHCRALAAIGPAAVPLLVEALTNKYGFAREVGTHALFLMGTNAQAAIPQLLKVAQTENSRSEIRRLAVLALANLGQDPQTWWPAALEFVHHTNEYIRSITVYELGQIGDRAKPAVPALLIALSDDHEGVRRNAAEALKKIDPEAAAKAGVK